MSSDKGRDGWNPDDIWRKWHAATGNAGGGGWDGGKWDTCGNGAATSKAAGSADTRSTAGVTAGAGPGQWNSSGLDDNAVEGRADKSPIVWEGLELVKVDNDFYQTNPSDIERPAARVATNDVKGSPIVVDVAENGTPYVVVEALEESIPA